MIKTVVIRHSRERLSKCSLTPLQGRKDVEFHRRSAAFTFDATGYTLLSIDAPVLSVADAGRPLLILDSTWRLLPALEDSLFGKPARRSLPQVPTAYPRKSKVIEDPAVGLASIEALYLARYLLGDDDRSLLEGYHWRDAFLNNVEDFFKVKIGQ